MENFLWVISYGSFCRDLSDEEWLSPVGFGVMDKIYTALEVPRKEMKIGIEAGGEFVVEKLMSHDEIATEEREACKASFQAMVDTLVAMPGKRAS